MFASFAVYPFHAAISEWYLPYPLFGESPNRATETVALPNSTASLRIGETTPRVFSAASICSQEGAVQRWSTPVRFSAPMVFPSAENAAKLKSDLRVAGND